MTFVQARVLRAMTYAHSEPKTSSPARAMTVIRMLLTRARATLLRSSVRTETNDEKSIAVGTAALVVYS